MSVAVMARCCNWLAETRGADGRGMEVSRDKVNACVARGLSVIQGDADIDLDDYPDKAFDYAVLSLTIQATRYPKTVPREPAAHRPPRDCVVSEFRTLADSHVPALYRQNAADPQPSRSLVRQPRLASVLNRRLCQIVRGGRRGDRAGRCFQLLGTQAAD